ncbi:MAG: TldD/PmbA family protein, partial [Myxococcales bacterium]|nr:TldD/PmbA family protein [Myxococcales bacterium]
MKDDTAELTSLAEKLVDRARKAGADVAEVSARSGWELSTKVRLGEPELVEEAGHRSVSMKVLRDERVAMSATSDLSEAGLERLVADAISLLDLSQPDPCEGPAEIGLLAKPPFPELDLYDPAVEEIDAAQALERAKLAEKAALGFDPRLTLSEGATFARTSGIRVMVLSSGFVGATRGSYAS